MESKDKKGLMFTLTQKAQPKAKFLRRMKKLFQLLMRKLQRKIKNLKALSLQLKVNLKPQKTMKLKSF